MLRRTSFPLNLEVIADLLIVIKVIYRQVHSTQYSQAVTHPSTNYARRCLTSVIGRELVYSTWYGRWHMRYYLLQNLNVIAKI